MSPEFIPSKPIICVIYKATCLISGKSYIGFTSDIQRRKVNHCWKAKNGSTYCFHRAIQKYGIENFVWKILWEGENETTIKNIEIQMIREHQTLMPLGYNMTEGGDGCLNPCGATRQKLSATSRGRKHTEKTRRKMSEDRIGRKHTEKTRQKMSEAHRGRQASEETRQKISKARKGKPLSAATRQKIRESLRGRKVSEATLLKRKGRRLTKETRRKISESRKNWWNQQKALV